MGAPLTVETIVFMTTGIQGNKGAIAFIAVPKTIGGTSPPTDGNRVVKARASRLPRVVSLEIARTRSIGSIPVGTETRSIDTRFVSSRSPGARIEIGTESASGRVDSTSSMLFMYRSIAAAQSAMRTSLTVTPSRLGAEIGRGTA